MTCKEGNNKQIKFNLTQVQIFTNGTVKPVTAPGIFIAAKMRADSIRSRKLSNLHKYGPSMLYRYDAVATLHLL